MATRFARNNGWDGRDRLSRIGEEGFNIIDDQFYGGNRYHRPASGGRPYAAPSPQEPQYHYRQYQNQQQQPPPYAYHGPSSNTGRQQPVITTEYQDRPRTYFHRQYQHHQSYHLSYEPQVITVRQQPVINSDEAAKMFGGMAVVEHRANSGFN